MQFKKWILLLSTASAFGVPDIRSMEKNQAALVDQNAKLLDAQNQFDAIKKDPEKELAYLKKLINGLSEKEEFERANKLEGKARTDALEQIYREKQRANAALLTKQNDTRLNPPVNAPNDLETTPSQYDEQQRGLRLGTSQEVDAQPYKDSFPRGRGSDTAEGKEVSPYDIQKSMLDNRRPKSASGPAVSSTDFQALGRVSQTQK